MAGVGAKMSITGLPFVDASPKPVNLIWLDISKEFCNTYLQGTMNGAMVPGACILPGISFTLAMDCMDATSSPTPVGMLTAVKLAKAFQSCFLQYLSLYQTGPPIEVPGFVGLVNDFMSVMSAPEQDPTKMMREIGKALDAYVGAAMVAGVFPSAPAAVPFNMSLF